MSQIEDRTILGIDFGLTFTGIAVSDKQRKLAVGVTTLDNLTGRALVRAVKSIADARKARTIVIGSPYEVDDSLLDMSDINHCNTRVVMGIMDLAEALQNAGFEIILWDEAYTTATVLSDRRRLGGGKNSRTKDWLDMAAATVILQSYLDSQGSPTLFPEDIY